MYLGWHWQWTQSTAQSATPGRNEEVLRQSGENNPMEAVMFKPTQTELESIIYWHMVLGLRLNLSGADLRGVILRRTDLQWAILRGANLQGADLSEAILCGANLSGADLSGADLSRADLSEAKLSWANLLGANLSGANLQGANLSEANLSWANLDEEEVSKFLSFGKLYKYYSYGFINIYGDIFIRMGCLFMSLDEWDKIGIENSNIKEFPNNGSYESERRKSAFNHAKAQMLLLKSTL